MLKKILQRIRAFFARYATIFKYLILVAALSVALFTVASSSYEKGVDQGKALGHCRLMCMMVGYYDYEVDQELDCWCYDDTSYFLMPF